MTENFFASGLYEDLLNFINGRGELPEGFSYRYYDPKTGQITEIDASNASEILGITPYEIPEITSFTDISSLRDFTIRSSNETFEKHLNSIKDSIVSSNILSSSNNISFTSTTKVPSKIPNITSNFFDTTTSLLTKLTNDILQFSRISVKYKEVDESLTNTATNLNNEVETNKNIQLSEDTYSQTKTTTTQNQTTNNWTNTTNNTTQTTYTNYSSSNNYTNYTNYNSTSPKEETPEVEITPTDRENYFPKYNELYSDDSKIVLEYTEDKTAHKVIIHLDNNKIIGIDHYYDYQTSTKAELAKSLILQEYIGNQNIEQLIQKDQYIKISFKEEMYANLTVDQLKEQYYSSYKEITKNTEV